MLSAVSWAGLFWTIQPSWPRDILSIAALTVSALAGASKYRGPRGPWLVAWTLLGSAVVGLLVWSLTLSSRLGFNYWTGWSPWVPSMAFLVFGMAYGRRRVAAWQDILIVGGSLAALVQAVGLICLGLGLVHVDPISPDGDFYGTRPIHASLSMLILLAFILLLTRPLPASSARLALTSVLGLSLVIGQHRSVWLATVVAAAVLLYEGLRAGRVPRAVGLPLAVTGSYLALAVLIPLVTQYTLLPRLGSSKIAAAALPDTVSSTHSLSWRFEMWSSSMSASRPIMNWLFGGVLGVNPVKWPGIGVSNPQITSHNMAIDVIVMFGLAGLVLMGYVFVRGILGPGVWRTPFGVFSLSLLAYGFFYPWPAWSWLAVGVAVSLGPISLGPRRVET